VLSLATFGTLAGVPVSGDEGGGYAPSGPLAPLSDADHERRFPDVERQESPVADTPLLPEAEIPLLTAEVTLLQARLDELQRRLGRLTDRP